MREWPLSVGFKGAISNFRGLIPHPAGLGIGLIPEKNIKLIQIRTFLKFDRRHRTIPKLAGFFLKKATGNIPIS